MRIQISVEIDEVEEIINCDVQGRYKSAINKISVKRGRDTIHLDEYLCEYPLLYRTTEDSMIMGNEIYEGNPDAISFDSADIEAIDWEKYGTDVSVEVKSGPGIVSIQDALEQILKLDKSYKYIIYDHTAGEIADFITVKEAEKDFIIELYHVKKMSGTTYNGSVDDIYEVAGQAVKSIVWLKTKPRLLVDLRKFLSHISSSFAVCFSISKK